VTLEVRLWGGSLAQGCRVGLLRIPPSRLALNQVRELRLLLQLSRKKREGVVVHAFT
jgi:hypothetical protein